MPQLYQYRLKVKYSLCIFISYAQAIHSKTNQELYGKHLCHQSSHYEKYEWSRTPPSISEISIVLLCQLFLSHYTPILVKKHLCSQGSHYEKYGQFPLHMWRKPSHVTTKSTHFAVSKDEWNTKEDTGESLKNALYLLWYSHLGLKWHRTVKN